MRMWRSLLDRWMTSRRQGGRYYLIFSDWLSITRYKAVGIVIVSQLLTELHLPSKLPSPNPVGQILGNDDHLSSATEAP